MESRTRQPKKYHSKKTVSSKDDVGLEWPRDSPIGSPDERIRTLFLINSTINGCHAWNSEMFLRIVDLVGSLVTDKRDYGEDRP